MPIANVVEGRVKRGSRRSAPVARVLDYDQSVPGRIESVAKGVEDLAFELQAQRNKSEEMTILSAAKEKANTAVLNALNTHGSAALGDGTEGTGVAAQGAAAFDAISADAVDSASNYIVRQNVKRSMLQARAPAMQSLMAHQIAETNRNIEESAEVMFNTARASVAAQPMSPANFDAQVDATHDAAQALVTTRGEIGAGSEYITRVRDLNAARAESLIAADMHDAAIELLENNQPTGAGDDPEQMVESAATIKARGAKKGTDAQVTEDGKETPELDQAFDPAAWSKLYKEATTGRDFKIVHTRSTAAVELAISTDPGNVRQAASALIMQDEGTPDRLKEATIGAIPDVIAAKDADKDRRRELQKETVYNELESKLMPGGGEVVVESEAAYDLVMSRTQDLEDTEDREAARNHFLQVLKLRDHAYSPEVEATLEWQMHNDPDAFIKQDLWVVRYKIPNEKWETFMKAKTAIMQNDHQTYTWLKSASAMLDTATGQVFNTNKISMAKVSVSRRAEIQRFQAYVQSYVQMLEGTDGTKLGPTEMQNAVNDAMAFWIINFDKDSVDEFDLEGEDANTIAYGFDDYLRALDKPVTGKVVRAEWVNLIDKVETQIEEENELKGFDKRIERHIGGGTAWRARMQELMRIEIEETINPGSRGG